MRPRERITILISILNTCRVSEHYMTRSTLGELQTFDSNKTHKKTEAILVPKKKEILLIGKSKVKQINRKVKRELSYQALMYAVIRASEEVCFFICNFICK